MIEIFRTKYKYTIRKSDHTDEAWFIKQGDKISQPLTWHEALGHIVQVMGEMSGGAPVYWENSEKDKYEFVGERF